LGDFAVAALLILTSAAGIISGAVGFSLFLHELKLLSFEKLLGNALGTSLRAQEQLPKLLAKWGGVLLEESGELYLK